MMNIDEICNRALTRPVIYVPALKDEITRLRNTLALYESAFSDIKSLAISSDLWNSQSKDSAAWVRRTQKLYADITLYTGDQS